MLARNTCVSLTFGKFKTSLVIWRFSEISKLKAIKGINKINQALEKFRSAGVDWPVWIMPVGAREEEQSATAGEVAQKAFRRGYNVAARVHVYLFGNAIGT